MREIEIGDVVRYWLADNRPSILGVVVEIRVSSVLLRIADDIDRTPLKMVGESVVAETERVRPVSQKLAKTYRIREENGWLNGWLKGWQ